MSTITLNYSTVRTSATNLLRVDTNSNYGTTISQLPKRATDYPNNTNNHYPIGRSHHQVVRYTPMTRTVPTFKTL